MLEAHVRQRGHGCVEHVGGVVAAAQAGLDDGHLDVALRELPKRGRSQQLELGDVVVLGERVIHALGRPGARAIAAAKAWVEMSRSRTCTRSL